MKENIYVLFDKKAGIALKPFMIERNDVVPIRQLTEATNNTESVLNKAPADFALMRVGTADIETLEIQPHEPVTVVEIADLVHKAE